MRALLVALRNLARRTGIFTVAEATAIYNRIWLAIGFVFLSCAVAFMTNARFGWQRPSLMLAITFAIVAMYVWAKPLHILVVAGGIGLASRISNSAIADEVENALTAYLGLLKWVLFAGITFLFITGTISFRENPGVILPALIGLSVAGLCIWLWPKLFTGVWARKLVYWYAVAVIVMSFVSLIPGAVWAKYTGWDPATIKPSNTEESLYRMDHLRLKMADSDRAEEIQRITDKIARRESLTEAEEQFIANARRSASAKPAPARAETMRSAICPNVSAEETRECLVGSSWSNWIQFANGARDDGKQICFSFGVQSERKDEQGVTFWRFRVADGTQDVKYRLFPADVKCVDIVL